jgi:predicted solute-binding protein
VNEYTRDYGPTGRKAVEQFLQTAHERGYIAKKPTVEFAE